MQTIVTLALTHPRTGRPIDPDRTPLDVTTAAYFCHKCRWLATAIAKHTDSPFSGKYTTLTRMTSWLLLHPEFRAQRYYEQRSKERAEEQKLIALQQNHSSGPRPARGLNRRHRAA